MSTKKCLGNCGKKLQCKKCDKTGSVCDCKINSDLKKQYGYVSACLHKCNNDCGESLQCGKCGTIGCSCFCSSSEMGYHPVPVCIHKCYDDCGKKLICRCCDKT